MIVSLFEDGSIFGKLENLVVNPDNPFLPYVNRKDHMDELMDGTWWPETIRRLTNFKDDPFIPGLDVVAPLVMYGDKTGVAGNQRYPLEPWLFTLAMIRRKLRNQPKSWRPLGYIPDLEATSSAEKRFSNTKNPGAGAQSYHAAFRYLLIAFAEVQRRGMVIWLWLGGHRKKVRIRPQ